MSNELYYRGSEEYAVAVKNQLQHMERQGIHDTNKIAFSIQNMEYGIRTDIRKSTYAIVASQEMLRQTFHQGFDSINNTLALGFGDISVKLSEVKEAIYQVGDKICSRLDEIHDIVNNPLLTASREFYRRALKNYQNGYYADALEDIKQAVEKNKTDYISWQLMGEIYLYGAGKYDNVINLDEAEKAFENAAKYIDADLKNSDDAKRLGMVIYYELGYTRFLQSNDLLVWGNETKSIEMLGKSAGNLSESLGYNAIKPEYVLSAETFEKYHSYFISNEVLRETRMKKLQEDISKQLDQLEQLEYGEEIESRKNELKELESLPKAKKYQIYYYEKILTYLAKDKHFQGKDDEALDLISRTIDADSNSALIFSTDKDFESIWSKIENLIEEKRQFLIGKIEEEQNKISKLELTQEEMNQLLAKYDSSVYKNEPFLSLVEILKKAMTLYGSKENEIKENKKFLQELKDFIAQCYKNERCYGKSVKHDEHLMILSKSSIYNFSTSYSTSFEDFINHYDAGFHSSIDSELYFFRIKTTRAVKKYINKLFPDIELPRNDVLFSDVISKIKSDMEQNFVKVYSFPELKDCLDILNKYQDTINWKKMQEDAKREQDEKDNEEATKVAKGCGIGCLVFIIIYILIAVVMCVSGVE